MWLSWIAVQSKHTTDQLCELLSGIPWPKKKKEKKKSLKSESECRTVMNRDRSLRRRLKIRIKGHILCVPSGGNTLETTLTV